MVLEEKGMALGKRDMVWPHAKRGWEKHYIFSSSVIFDMPED